MKKQQLLESFEKLNAVKRIIDCSYCTECPGCEGCFDCHDCVKCIDCTNCQICCNCIECIDCSYCLLCKNLENKKRGYWLLNKQVTKIEFEAALKELKGE